ncbi:helix-turn-helix domain-containing protein [Paenibacillus methanolicus]|uniref:Purine catabolism regulator n=1 Tax=Paenibacillus methanolicus TaxID=582686 RepID=A0A5S5C2G2_9BACL|nr:helix-turn-helix domain-containing protein [Paenibacillus methanolicus]TYP73349.1 purine catabolism regulator [Paenibacillus methanolicus]
MRLEPASNKETEEEPLPREWKALFAQIPRESMNGYVEQVLGPLMPCHPGHPRAKLSLRESNERRQREELLLTLETLIACDGQINELANRLYIHRNTAAYRIEKLEKLLGLQLKQTDSLLRLKLAFVFRRLLSEEERDARTDGNR